LGSTTGSVLLLDGRYSFLFIYNIAGAYQSAKKNEADRSEAGPLGLLSTASLHIDPRQANQRNNTNKGLALVVHQAVRTRELKSMT
jgi:hypothetical protein